MGNLIILAVVCKWRAEKLLNECINGCSIFILQWQVNQWRTLDLNKLKREFDSSYYCLIYCSTWVITCSTTGSREAEEILSLSCSVFIGAQDAKNKNKNTHLIPLNEVYHEAYNCFKCSLLSSPKAGETYSLFSILAFIT